MESDSDLLAMATAIARDAGKILLTHFREDHQISKKGQIDLVTEMDLKAEKLIVDQILLRFPDHEILAEEQGY